MALANGIKPEVATTVFAGQDREATDRARSYFTGYAPSSPSIALFKDGELVERAVGMMPKDRLASTLNLAAHSG